MWYQHIEGSLKLHSLFVLTMYDWLNFDVVFQGKLDYSYDEKTVNAILKNRKELGGTLFFDRVWSNLGLKDGEYECPSISQPTVWRDSWDTSRPRCLSTVLKYVSHEVIPSSHKS
jgi:hypothetical protein